MWDEQGQGVHVTQIVEYKEVAAARAELCPPNCWQAGLVHPL